MAELSGLKGPDLRMFVAILETLAEQGFIDVEPTEGEYDTTPIYDFLVMGGFAERTSLDSYWLTLIHPDACENLIALLKSSQPELFEEAKLIDLPIRGLTLANLIDLPLQEQTYADLMLLRSEDETGDELIKRVTSYARCYMIIQGAEGSEERPRLRPPLHELRMVRDFVLSRRADIEKDVENFGTLKPVLDYFLEEAEG